MIAHQDIRVRALQLPPITEVASLAACLSEPEQQLMASHRHPRRRLEFVAGRLALKCALLEGSSTVCIGAASPPSDSLLRSMQRLQVLPDEEGRPRLWIEDALVWAQVSIAHAAGWAAAVCSPRSIGVDIVELGTSTAIPDDLPWLTGIAPDWRMRLRALLWGVRECLMKSGQVDARNVWGLDGVDALPVESAEEIIARWPTEATLAPLEIQVNGRVVAGSFVSLSPSTLLIMTSMSSSQQPNGMPIQ
jgi:phosphopantetheinyl transferase (holo-ACP synthase)